MRVVQQTPTPAKGKMRAEGTPCERMPPPSIPLAPSNRQYETPQRRYETPQRRYETPQSAYAPPPPQPARRSETPRTQHGQARLFEVSQNARVESQNAQVTDIPEPPEQWRQEEPLFLAGPSQMPPSSQQRGPMSQQQEPMSPIPAEEPSEPLFLLGPSQFASSQPPPASQITSNDPEALRQVESMTQEELDAMFDMGDVDLELEDDAPLGEDGTALREDETRDEQRTSGAQDTEGRRMRAGSYEALVQADRSFIRTERSFAGLETQFAATQSSETCDDSRAFHPLFED